MSKKSFQILLMSLLPTCALVVYSLAGYFLARANGDYYGSGTEVFWFIGICLVLTALPLYLSGFSASLARYFSYGIPFLIAAYSLWHLFTCTGKFCDLLDIPIIFSMGIFMLVYTLGIFLRKWSEETLMVLLWVEGALLALPALFLF